MLHRLNTLPALKDGARGFCPPQRSPDPALVLRAAVPRPLLDDGPGAIVAGDDGVIVVEGIGEDG